METSVLYYPTEKKSLKYKFLVYSDLDLGMSNCFLNVTLKDRHLLTFLKYCPERFVS